VTNLQDAVDLAGWSSIEAAAAATSIGAVMKTSRIVSFGLSAFPLALVLAASPARAAILTSTDEARASVVESAAAPAATQPSPMPDLAGTTDEARRIDAQAEQRTDSRQEVGHLGAPRSTDEARTLAEVLS
jgi:hypothetical protein